jgi:hypothetical protein
MRILLNNNKLVEHTTRRSYMPIVTLPGGQVRDEIRETIYDTIDIAPTEGPIGQRKFFANVQGKSLAKSNLEQNGALQTAVSFRVLGLCLDAQNIELGNDKVIPLYLEKSSLRLKIGEKDYWKGPARFAAGRMTQNAMTTVAATTVLHQQYGWSAIQPVIFSAQNAIDIPPLQNFVGIWEVSQQDVSVADITAMTPSVASTVVSFVLSLKGTKRRPVQ